MITLTDVTALPESLFADGLTSIHAFLSDRELLTSAAAVNRHWFHVAATKGTKRSVSIAISDLTEYLKQMEKVKGKSATATTTASISRWSLGSHVIALQIENIHWNHLADYIREFTHLIQIDIQNIADSTDESESVMSRVYSLPQSITRFTLGADSKFRALQSVLNTIAELSSLDFLNLDMVLKPQRRSELDWSVLEKLPNLKILTLQLMVAPGFMKSFGKVGTDTLRTLQLNVWDDGKAGASLTAADYATHKYTQLKQLDISESRVSKDFLLAISVGMPNLRVMQGKFELTKAVAHVKANPSSGYSLPLFPHCTTFTHYLPLDLISGHWGAVAGDDDPLWIAHRDALCAAFHPDRFNSIFVFERSLPTHVWNALHIAYPNLYHIAFHQQRWSFRDSMVLDHIEQSSIVTRISILDFVSCNISLSREYQMESEDGTISLIQYATNEGPVDDFFVHLGSFTNLTMLSIKNSFPKTLNLRRSIAEGSMYRIFNDSKYLPNLAELIIIQRGRDVDNFDIHWIPAERINHWIYTQVLASIYDQTNRSARKKLARSHTELPDNMSILEAFRHSSLVTPVDDES